jgi:YD repeat-containing protein
MTRFKGLVVVVGALCVTAICRSDADAAAATYAYDDLGRLTAVLNNDNTGEVYTYDKAGNRTATYNGSPSVFSIANVTVSEGSAAGLTVQRAGDASTTASVMYYTKPGSATPGVNYTTIVEPGTTLNFAISSASQPVSVPTIQDGKYDVAKTFIVRLDAPSTNAAIGTAVGDATVTVNNIDPAPVFSINSPAAVNEGTAITFTVTKTNATNLTHSVSYATVAGTATSGADFTGQSNTLTFLPSETTKQVTIATVPSDGLYENSETFTATLSAPTNGAVLGTATGTGTITNTDPAPTFTVNSPAAVVEGQNVVFTITRTGGSALSHNVTRVTANGTAVAPTNYTALTSAALTFPPSAGNATQTVSVVTKNDGVVATGLTFTLNLSGATNGATITQASGTGTINEDNTPPGTPGGITPGFQYKTSATQSYSLNWTAPTTGVPTRYELYRSTNSFATQTLIQSNMNLSYIGSVSTNAEYSFRVRACNTYGCGPYSGTANVLICINGMCN